MAQRTDWGFDGGYERLNKVLKAGRPGGQLLAVHRARYPDNGTCEATGMSEAMKAAGLQEGDVGTPSSEGRGI